MASLYPNCNTTSSTVMAHWLESQTSIGRSNATWASSTARSNTKKPLRPDETASDCVFREKKREDAMRADLRGMTRFIWAEVMPHSSRRTMAELAQSLDQSYRLYVRGRTIIAG
jgi:hypothetical protein